MTDFQSAFDTNTSGINTTLKTQLSSVQQWSNIPGSLVKASSSQAGYLWGFNSINKVWVCQQPCTGKWTEVGLSKLVTPPPPPPPAQPTNFWGIANANFKPQPTIGNAQNFGGIVFDRDYITIYDNTGELTRISPAFTELKNAEKSGTLNNYQLDLQYSSTKRTYKITNSNFFGGSSSMANITVATTEKLESIFNDMPVVGFTITKGSTPPPPPPPPPPSPPTVTDIATDETNVYLLFNSGGGSSLATKTANNQTEWSVIPIGNGFVPANIFSTHTYLWLQTASNQKIKIPKPVNMTNTMPHPDTSVKITSSSATALYGVDATGKAMKSDETLQTGWAPVSGLKGTNVKTVIGDLDQEGLFYIDNNSRVSKCVGDCSTEKSVFVNTQGYLPLYMTADPSTKQLWMTSSTSGSVGNIFNRIATPDYSSIMNTVTPLDQNRDKVVGDVNVQYNKQTEVMTLNKQISEFQTLFAKIFGDATRSTEDTNLQISKVETDVVGKQTQLKTITNIEPIIQKFVVTLATAALVYAVFSFLGWIVHAIVLVVIGVGIYLSLNNDVNLSSLWARLP
jgi:hypothetical protein